MILLDLFSGIGGFSLGLDKWVTKHYYSEIDKHAIAIYKHNFKESIYVGSVESIGDIERPNIITFGSPCQDFSIAGKRSGLEGSRSSLIQYALNTISKFRPDVFIWENVKGVFSSNDGADFWAIVKAFADIGGYRLEWQLLNTAWFLPQNRERIYLIGHLAEGSTRNIFPIGEDDPSYNRSKTRTKSKTNISATIAGHEKCRKENSFVIVDRKLSPKNQQNRAACLSGGAHSGGNHSDMDLLLREPDAVEYRRYKKDPLSGDEISPTIYPSAMAKNSDNNVTIKSNNSIRRLTEIECERLQGFPDNWTQYGDYDEVKKVSKTQRYKCLGNAVTVNVVRAIGTKLF